MLYKVEDKEEKYAEKEIGEDPLDTTDFVKDSKAEVELDKDNREAGKKCEGLKCNKCAYKASDTSDLDCHASKVHGKTKDYSCKQCGREFSHIKSFKKHEKTHERGYVKLKCDQCPYDSHNKHHLKEHIDAVHKKIKSFSCKLCEYAASYKYALKRHINQIHVKKGNLDENQRKDYVCNQCESAFTKRSHLKKHISTVHDARKEDKKFNCIHCPFVTHSKDYLRKHMKRGHLRNIHLKVEEVLEDIKVEEKVLPENETSASAFGVPSLSSSLSVQTSYEHAP